MLYNGFMGWICVLLRAAGEERLGRQLSVQICEWTVLSALNRVPLLPEKVRAD